MKQILPGILRLQVVDCSLLPPNVSLKSKANLPISVLADTTEISFVGSPKCEYNIKNDNNSTSEKTILEFLTDEYFPFDEQNVAFIISCASGKSYLIYKIAHSVDFIVFYRLLSRCYLWLKR